MVSSPRRSTNSFWWHADNGYWCVVPTNSVVKSHGGLVMGAGLAGAVRDEVPGIDRHFGERFNVAGPGVFTGTLPNRNGSTVKLISFPTKRHWSEQSLISLVERSAIQLIELCDDLTLDNIFVPKVGCGLGGLDWTDVETVLDAVLDQRFVLPQTLPEQKD